MTTTLADAAATARVDDVAAPSAALTAVRETHNLVLDLLDGFDPVRLGVDVAVIAAALVLTWLIARTIRRRLDVARRAKGVDEAVNAGVVGLQRVLYPLIAWVLLLVGRWALHRVGHPGHLLNVAIPLSSSLVLIRAAVYLLRMALPDVAWVRSSERAVAWTMWVGAGLHITGLLGPIRDFLDELALPLGKHSISVLNVLEGTFSVALTLLGALWLGRLVEGRLMKLAAMDMSLRVVFSKLARTLLIVVGVLIALPLVGIDVTVLSVFGGALGVGLGFGLQKIAANYISGFVILLDRSVRLGDLVTIDNRYGEVTKLTTRYLVVRATDGSDHLIPNETVITSPVANHSYADRMSRVDFTLQVDYGVDLRVALECMVEAAQGQPRVLEKPAPLAVVRQFGGSGIDLDLMVFIADPENGKAALRSDIAISIYERLTQRGIPIPYPQQEIRITEWPAMATYPAASAGGRVETTSGSRPADTMLATVSPSGDRESPSPG